MIPKYKVNDIFASIQGEGAWTGLPVVFVRLAGCNMNCPFCDTGHEDYREMTPAEILLSVTDRIVSLKKNKEDELLTINRVVITGGEPLIQDILELIILLIQSDYIISVETNGSIKLISPLCYYITHASLSPKAPRKDIKITHADSLKLLYPYQNGATIDEFKDFPARWKCLQPIDFFDDTRNQQCIKECYDEVMRIGGDWRIGLQIHKIIGVR